MDRRLIATGEEVWALIPQRPPIVMIDKFYEGNGACSYSGLTISEHTLFFEDDCFREPGIMEHIAQSAAAWIGYLFKQREEPVPVGYIGSIDKLKISFLPKVGDELFTEIKVIQEVYDITLIGAIVKIGNEVVAECRMKIFLKK